MVGLLPFLKSRATSFLYAGRGLARLVREEKNARIHAGAALAVLSGAAWLRFSAAEWSLIVLAIALVFATEAANSAIERLADAVSRERHPLIGAAKDLGAASVLIASIGAFLVGCITFGARLVR